MSMPLIDDTWLDEHEAGAAKTWDATDEMKCLMRQRPRLDAPQSCRTLADESWRTGGRQALTGDLGSDLHRAAIG